MHTIREKIRHYSNILDAYCFSVDRYLKDIDRLMGRTHVDKELIPTKYYEELIDELYHKYLDPGDINRTPRMTYQGRPIDEQNLFYRQSLKVSKMNDVHRIYRRLDELTQDILSTREVLKDLYKQSRIKEDNKTYAKQAYK